MLKTISIILLLVYHAQAVMFNLAPNAQKCLKDEMQANQLVVGDFEATDVPGQKIDYVVSRA